jgi:hypothetical protein
VYRMGITAAVTIWFAVKEVPAMRTCSAAAMQARSTLLGVLASSRYMLPQGMSCRSCSMPSRSSMLGRCM